MLGAAQVGRVRLRASSRKSASRLTPRSAANAWRWPLDRWAAIAAGFLAPGGLLYLADGHPAALVFDDAAARDTEKPGWFSPYFETEPLVLDEAEDHAN